MTFRRSALLFPRLFEEPELASESWPSLQLKWIRFIPYTPRSIALRYLPKCRAGERPSIWIAIARNAGAADDPAPVMMLTRPID